MRAIFFVTILLIIVGLWFYFTRSNPPGVPSGSTEDTLGNASRNQYENSQYGFSFQKPEGYTVGEFDQDEGKIILVQVSKTVFDTKNAMPRGTLDTGFQITITPFDEMDTVITKARINKDIPDMKVENSKEISITGKDTQGSPMYTKGLEFESNNATFGGASAEIWFVYPVRDKDSNGVRGANLYQLSGYHDSLPVMESVVQSWEFQ